jgi:hypothetical protein
VVCFYHSALKGNSLGWQVLHCLVSWPPGCCSFRVDSLNKTKSKSLACSTFGGSVAVRVSDLPSHRTAWWGEPEEKKKSL